MQRCGTAPPKPRRRKTATATFVTSAAAAVVLLQLQTQLLLRSASGRIATSPPATFPSFACFPASRSVVGGGGARGRGRGSTPSFECHRRHTTAATRGCSRGSGSSPDPRRFRRRVATPARPEPRRRPVWGGPCPLRRLSAPRRSSLCGARPGNDETIDAEDSGSVDDDDDDDDDERGASSTWSDFGGDDESVYGYTPNDKIRYRARVSYRGTHFDGWQVQPDRRTVQGDIEGVLSRRFLRRVSALGAGRTDAGVHARGQAVQFDLSVREEILRFFRKQQRMTDESQPSSDDVETNATANEELVPMEGHIGINRTHAMADKDERKSELVTVTTSQQIEFCLSLQNSMNRMLPPDVRLWNLSPAPVLRRDGADSPPSSLPFADEPRRERQWHVIQDAASKWYSYRFALGPMLDPSERFTRAYVVHRNVYPAIGPGDIERLRRILKIFEGTHDFAAFGGQLDRNQKKSGRLMRTVRTVYRVDLVKEDHRIVGDDDGGSVADDVIDAWGFAGEEGHYRIDFLLKGALYKMVRNMVGTALEVWLGRMEEERLIDMLKRTDVGIDGEEGENRNNGGQETNVKTQRRTGREDNPCKPAPPEGLTLECVYFDDGF